MSSDLTPPRPAQLTRYQVLILPPDLTAICSPHPSEAPRAALPVPARPVTALPRPCAQSVCLAAANMPESALT